MHLLIFIGLFLLATTFYIIGYKACQKDNKEYYTFTKNVITEKKGNEFISSNLKT